MTLPAYTQTREGGAPFRYRFLGRRPLVPVGAGVVMGWVGTLVDFVSPGDRAPASLSMEGRRATTRDVVSPVTEPPSTSQPFPPPPPRRLPPSLQKTSTCKSSGALDHR